MPISEDQKSSESSKARDHMANERTFLAWVRTSIGIMAFGFVVGKFVLFIKEITLLLGESRAQMLPTTSSLQGYSSIFGVLIVSLGVLICFLAFIKYKNVEKQIETSTYQPSKTLNTILAFYILLIGIFLVFYLNNNT